MPVHRSLLAGSTALCVAAAVLVAAPAASATTASSRLAEAAASAAVAAGPSPIVVTEILADTTDKDHFEYFEVHNTSAAAIDLGAAGIAFEYAFSDDAAGDARDKALTVDGPLVLAAGETAVLWLSYTSADGTVDSFAYTEEQFRAHHGMDGAAPVVRVTGQAGLANGGDRGIRVVQGDTLLSWSFYPTGSMAANRAVHFRLAADPTAPRLDVFGMQAQPSPGTVLPEALAPAPEDPEQPEPEQPEPTPTPGAGPAANWPLIVTEIAPDNTGTDNYEYFEVHNPTAAAIDLAAAGYSFGYTYADGRTPVPLAVQAATTIAAGETVVFWLSYTATNIDSFAKSEADFRAAWGSTEPFRLVRVTGQPGMANGGDRGIAVVKDGGIVSSSLYPTGSVAVDRTAHFRIPGDTTKTAMELLEGPAAPSPGVVAPEALQLPAFDPQPDPAVVTAPLQITELLPDSANVGTGDGYEFVEVYNASSAPIDFADYSINYLYPDNGNETLWPATPSDVVIPAGDTLVLWIKNGQNDRLGDTDFNTVFGTDLTMGEGLVEIFSGGMANGSARGIEIVTNTGHSVSSAFYNMNLPTDDTQADQGIRYTTDADDLTVQNLLDIVPATPGAVQRDQVPGGLMIVPVDTVAPVVTDRTAAEIDPAAGFPLTFQVTDDVQVRTVSVALSNDVDTTPVVMNLLDVGDDTFAASIDAADLHGKAWYEYTVTVSDGTNEVVSATKRLPVRGANTDPVRLALTEGQFVAGITDVTAAGETFPSPIELSIGGEVVETTATLEGQPLFVMEATGIDYYFKNGVRAGADGEVLSIFDTGIYTGSETLVTPVPVEYAVQGEDLVVSVWAGSKKAPEIDLDENNDDFTVWDLRLVLPNGQTLRPTGYDDPNHRLPMGDSVDAENQPTGKLDSYNARFALPADAFAAVTAEWDTTAVADGPIEVRATDGDHTAERRVVVDNTAPEIDGVTVVDGTAYQGDIDIAAEVSDSGSGVASTVLTLDGVEKPFPFTTSSLELEGGEHAVEITSTDVLGNTATWTGTFTTYDEYPTGGTIAPAEGAQVEAGDVTLQARVDDPAGDALDVSFFEGRRVDLAEGEVQTRSGTVNDALDVQRDEPAVVSGDELMRLAAVDGVSTEVASDAEFPYQLFDVAVTEPGAQVRAAWSGRANAGATVILYALRADGSAWDEVTRHVATGADEQFTLEGVVSADAHAVDGSVRLLVQHSEGFAGGNLSTRDSVVTPGHPEDVDRSEYDFTIGWESDTQYYNENTVEGEPYRHQQAIHSYFLEQRENMNLQYMFHTGDIIDDYDQIYQWDNADPEYQRLDDAGLPYGVLAGNHDVGNHLQDYTNYGTYFGEDRFASNPWYGGSYEDNRGHFDLISAGGIDFVMLYTGWLPDDASIGWMNEVLAQHPDRVAIIAQHEFLLGTGGLGEIPQRVMDEVVAVNPNVRMVLSGHYHDAYTRTDGFDDDGDGVDDRTVTSMLFDYQGLPEGGLGYLRLLHFDNEGERMMVRTYSPSLQDYNADAVGSLEDAPQSFELPYDQLGIDPVVRTLGTDAFSAEILGANEIAAFEDVPSGSVLSATWTLDEVGERGWYVRTTDPYDAVDYSPVAMFSVIPAAVVPVDPTEPVEPGTPGTGPGAPDAQTPGSGTGAADGGGAPSGQAGGGSPADDLATTGSNAGDLMPWTLGALLMALGGAALLLMRRRGGSRSA